MIIRRERQRVPLVIWYPQGQFINQRLGLILESKLYREDGSKTTMETTTSSWIPDI